MIKTLAILGIITLSLSSVALFRTPTEDKQENRAEVAAVEETAAAKAAESQREASLCTEKQTETETETEENDVRSAEEIFAEVERQSGSTSKSGAVTHITVPYAEDEADIKWSPIYKFG